MRPSRRRAAMAFSAMLAALALLPSAATAAPTPIPVSD